MRVVSWLLGHFLTWALDVPLFLGGRRSDGSLTSSLEGHLREGAQEGKSGRVIKRCGALGHAHNADLKTNHRWGTTSKLKVKTENQR